MARVLVAVDDPLCLKPENEGKPKLLVGQYIQAEIEGTTLNDIVVVDRAMLRNGDWVWIMGTDNMLEIRAVDVVYRGIDRVLVRDGLQDGDRIVVTDIATVAEGMELRLEDADATESDETEGAEAVS